MVRRSRRTAKKPPEVVPPNSDEEPDVPPKKQGRGAASSTDDEVDQRSGSDDESVNDSEKSNKTPKKKQATKATATRAVPARRPRRGRKVASRSNSPVATTTTTTTTALETTTRTRRSRRGTGSSVATQESVDDSTEHEKDEDEDASHATEEEGSEAENDNGDGDNENELSKKGMTRRGDKVGGVTSKKRRAKKSLTPTATPATSGNEGGEEAEEDYDDAKVNAIDVINYTKRPTRGRRGAAAAAEEGKSGKSHDDDDGNDSKKKGPPASRRTRGRDATPPIAKPDKKEIHDGDDGNDDDDDERSNGEEAVKHSTTAAVVTAKTRTGHRKTKKRSDQTFSGDEGKSEDSDSSARRPSKRKRQERKAEKDERGKNEPQQTDSNSKKSPESIPNPEANDVVQRDDVVQQDEEVQESLKDASTAIIDNVDAPTKTQKDDSKKGEDVQMGTTEEGNTANKEEADIAEALEESNANEESKRKLNIGPVDTGHTNEAEIERESKRLRRGAESDGVEGEGSPSSSKNDDIESDGVEEEGGPSSSKNDDMESDGVEEEGGPSSSKNDDMNDECQELHTTVAFKVLKKDEAKTAHLFSGAAEGKDVGCGDVKNRSTNDQTGRAEDSSESKASGEEQEATTGEKTSAKDGTEALVSAEADPELLPHLESNKNPDLAEPKPKPAESSSVDMEPEQKEKADAPREPLEAGETLKESGADKSCSNGNMEPSLDEMVKIHLESLEDGVKSVHTGPQATEGPEEEMEPLVKLTSGAPGKEGLEGSSHTNRDDVLAESTVDTDASVLAQTLEKKDTVDNADTSALTDCGAISGYAVAAKPDQDGGNEKTEQAPTGVVHGENVAKSAIKEGTNNDIASRTTESRGSKNPDDKCHRTNDVPTSSNDAVTAGSSVGGIEQKTKPIQESDEKESGLTETTIHASLTLSSLLIEKGTSTFGSFEFGAKAKYINDVVQESDEIAVDSITKTGTQNEIGGSKASLAALESLPVPNAAVAESMPVATVEESKTISVDDIVRRRVETTTGTALAVGEGEEKNAAPLEVPRGPNKTYHAKTEVDDEPMMDQQATTLVKDGVEKVSLVLAGVSPMDVESPENVQQKSDSPKPTEPTASTEEEPSSDDTDFRHTHKEEPKVEDAAKEVKYATFVEADSKPAKEGIFGIEWKDLEDFDHSTIPNPPEMIQSTKTVALSQLKTAQTSPYGSSDFYGYEESKIKRVKAILFAAGSTVHQGRGFERAFAEYWDALCLRLSDRLSSHTSDRCDMAIAAFLKSPKLRRLHNRFIMSIMKRASRALVPLYDVADHVPAKWQDRVKVKVTERVSKEVIDTETRAGLLEDEFLRITDMPHLKIGNPYMPMWTPPSIVKEQSLVASQVDEYATGSSRIPGAIAILPQVTETLGRMEMQVSDDAMWLLVIALKEHTKKVLRDSIALKQASEAGRVGVPTLRYPKVLAAPAPHKRRKSDALKARAMIHAQQKEKQERKSITPFDIFAAAQRYPTGQIGSLGGSFSRFAVEHTFHSAFNSLPTFEVGQDFRDVQNFLSTQVAEMAAKMKADTPKTCESNSRNRQSSSNQRVDNSNKTLQSAAARQPVANTTESGQRSEQASVARSPQAISHPPESARQPREASVARMHQSPPLTEPVPTKPVETATHAPNYTVVQSTGAQLATQEQTAATPTAASITAYSVPGLSTQSQAPIVRGVGRGAKDLAALMKRSASSTPPAAEGNAPDVNVNATDNATSEEVRESGSKSKLAAEGNIAATPTNDTVTKAKKENTESKTETPITASGRRGKGIGAKNLAAMLARSKSGGTINTSTETSSSGDEKDAAATVVETKAAVETEKEQPTQSTEASTEKVDGTSKDSTTATGFEKSSADNENQVTPDADKVAKNDKRNEGIPTVDDVANDLTTKTKDEAEGTDVVTKESSGIFASGVELDSVEKTKDKAEDRDAVAKKSSDIFASGVESVSVEKTAKSHDNDNTTPSEANESQVDKIDGIVDKKGDYDKTA